MKKYKRIWLFFILLGVSGLPVFAEEYHFGHRWDETAPDERVFNHGLVKKIEPQGNVTSDSFDDTRMALQSGYPITGLRIRCGDIVDQIQAINGKYGMGLHGGEGGGASEIWMERGDYLTKIFGYYGNWYGQVYITQISFRTAHGRVYGPFGKNGGATMLRRFRLEAPFGEQIIALTGSTANASESDGHISTFLSALGVSLISR